MFSLPDVFEVDRPIEAEKPKSAWKIPEPTIENAEEKKQLFGIELAKAPAFQAACAVFGDDTSSALWVSQNWLNDPVVVAAKDKYLKAADVSQVLLDKQQLARKFLTMAEEKNPSNTFYILDGKDRLKSLELYAKLMNYLDDKSTPTPINFTHNQMTIKLVEAEKKEQKVKTIDHNEEIIDNSNSTPLKLKLVG